MVLHDFGSESSHHHDLHWGGGRTFIRLASKPERSSSPFAPARKSNVVMFAQGLVSYMGNVSPNGMIG